MATIQNIEVAVDVDISKALAALTKLQNELRDLASEIESVDQIGREGIDVNTSLDQLDSELAGVKAEMEAFEKTESLDIVTNLKNSEIATLRGIFRDAVADGIGSGIVDGASGGGISPPSSSGTSLQAMEISSAPTHMLGRDSGSVVKDRSGTSGLFENLSKSLKDTLSSLSSFKLRMSDMHNVLATLVPLLLTFVGAVPIVVTSILTLAAAAVSAAAALLAIGGFGALGVAMGDSMEMPSGEDFSEIFEGVREDFFEAFAPLAMSLAPLFEDGLDGLEMFFNAIADKGKALMSLTDNARAFGNFIIDYFPDVLASMAGMVEAVSPLFSDIAAYLQDADILRRFVELTMKAIPTLKSLAKQIVAGVIALTEMSVGFAAVASIVLSFIGTMASLVGLFGFTNEQLGLMVGGVLTLVSAVALANAALLAWRANGIAAAVTGIYAFFVGLIQANSAMTYLAATAVGQALTSIYGFVTALFAGEIGLFSFASAGFTATGAIAALMTIASLGALAGLAVVATGVASEFLGMADGIDSSTAALKEFDKVAGKTGGGNMNPYGGPNGAPQSGAADARFSGTGDSTVVFNSSGNREQDKSQSDSLEWAQGRSTGSQA